MVYFSLLLFKIIPLYALILMGYLSGKWLDANRDTIAKILFFMITPIIIFNGVIHTRLDSNVLVLPLLTFGVSSILCIGFYNLSKLIWHDASKNLTAFSAGSGNTGYFGLPMALLLFDEQGEGVYIMAILGSMLYDNSMGYYILAKGSHSAKECIMKLIKLPSLYALALGLAFNIFQFKIPELFSEFSAYMKSTYTVLGMMVIGLGLSGLNHLKLDYKFIGMTFLAKFVAWPLLMLFIITTDAYCFHFFNPTIYNVLMLISIVPLAANMVVLASLFKNQPEKAATAVALSFIFAIVYVPVMTTYFIQDDPNEITMEVNAKSSKVVPL